MDRLEQSTPELTTQERQSLFGGRSPDEREQLAEVFEQANKLQRYEMYSVLRGWVREMVAPQN